MAYTIIQPPFTLKFREMSKKELVAYCEWFHAITPERIAELTKAVTGTPGFQAWKPDLAPASLDASAWLGPSSARGRTGALPTGRAQALRELCERMPAEARGSHGRAQRGR